MKNEISLKYPFLNTYWFSFSVAILILIIVFIFTTPEAIFQQEDSAVNLDFVELSLVAPQKPKTDVSSELGDVEKTNTENNNNDDEGVPVDLDSKEGIPRPKTIGRLRITHPPLAVELEVEAKAFLRVVIDKYGNIKNLQVLRIIIQKEIPPDLKKKLVTEFKENTLKAFEGKKYTPVIIDGRARAADMTQEIDITLK